VGAGWISQEGRRLGRGRASDEGCFSSKSCGQGALDQSCGCSSDADVSQGVGIAVQEVKQAADVAVIDAPMQRAAGSVVPLRVRRKGPGSHI
jgi:hypothetical protein